jgi:lipopolysaccharide transport system ATP-binding protein
MSDLAIRVEGLSKLYRLGPRERYRTLRDTLTDTLMAPFRRRRSAPSSELIWALKDVSFEVNHGEVIGIIGRNGAGKSTLLKILSRITEPTEGRAVIHGRVGSLLEVGTGFHPELSGRENIFLNGAILGMKRAEIHRKFDEIVAFAEVEKFIDTPVKHYSSGMYMRLAFAVAAHLDPELLLVDEVLAVGDLAFQKKCLGKMGEVAKTGRTVVLVTHQLNQIRRICQRCIWMENGKLHQQGLTSQVVSAYESSTSSTPFNGTAARNTSKTAAQFIRWELLRPPSDQPHILSSREACTVRFTVAARKSVRTVHHGIALFDSNQSLIWAAESNDISLNVGVHHFDHQLPGLPVRPGPYYWQVSLHDAEGLLDLWNAVPELVVDTELRSHHRDEWQGILNLPSAIQIRSVG